jgi:hypothetical protein
MGFNNPRRFNDKIALQQMRQAEHEKHVREIRAEVNAHVQAVHNNHKPPSPTSQTQHMFMSNEVFGSQQYDAPPPSHYPRQQHQYAQHPIQVWRCIRTNVRL